MIYITPAQHAEMSRDAHPSQRQPHIQPVSQPLYVIAVIDNPERYHSRHRNYHVFAKHVQDAGAILYTVELALGDRHHELTTHGEPHHIQLRSEHVLWTKENLINLGVSRLPADWHYASYIDADFILTRSDWAVETIHQLQHHPWVQMFSSYSDLGPDHSMGPANPGFVKLLKDGFAPGDPYNKGALWGAPGGAWAWRRQAFDQVGGLLDICILGSADYHMAVALAESPNHHRECRTGPQPYIQAIDDWSERAWANRGRIGMVPCHALHLYHGPRTNRAYAARSQILVDHQFNPARDLRRDWQGVLGFSGNKPALEEAVLRYFRSRNEDAMP